MRLVSFVIAGHFAFVFFMFFFHTPVKHSPLKKVHVRTLVLSPPPATKINTPTVASLDTNPLPIEPPSQQVIPKPQVQETPKTIVEKESPKSNPTSQVQEQPKAIVEKEQPKSKPKPHVQEKPKEIAEKELPKDKPKVEVKKNTQVVSKEKTGAISRSSQEKLASLMQESLKTLENSNRQTKSTSKAPSTKIGMDNLSCLTALETTYQEMLVQYLQIQLSFPESGEVKIKLTLQRNGRVDQLSILESSSIKNQQYIQQMMPMLSLPEFGSHFKGESKHTFSLTLTSKNSH